MTAPFFACLSHGSVLSRTTSSAISMIRSSAAYTVDASSSLIWHLAMSMLILKVHDRRRSDPSINSVPVGVQNQGTFLCVFRQDLVVIVDRNIMKCGLI
ncbi:hypothetical protein PENSOL_c001G04969 [Penicillium solitum]|uniref:Uncharacterized protein n=1 Tax=Penicillium solitum TaxID=60172 RepID=A0A1V6RPW5_9EURO|nr:uncharacterized protein PENSOL_c001G04969 [Penicillium solitum]OQE03570.1 hypothetical protein PENSOL_c001G04969 [Penicillium solitum]